MVSADEVPFCFAGFDALDVTGVQPANSSFSIAVLRDHLVAATT
jgi:hypothetical protein